MFKKFFKKKEIILYLIFGVLTTIVNIVAFFVCDKIKLPTALSTVIAWILSVSFAFITNKTLVFKSTSNKLFKEFSSFITSRLFTGLLDLAIMVIFVDLLHLEGIPVKIISNVVVIVLNYVLSKWCVFKI